MRVSVYSIAFGAIGLAIGVCALTWPWSISQAQQDDLNDLVAALGGADFVADIDTVDFDGWFVPSGAVLRALPSGDGLPTRLLLAGVPSDDSPGGVPGIAIRVTDDFENAASGKSVEVEIIARSVPPRDGGLFSVAYSTREVGNSGWRQFDLTSEFRSYRFIYDVNPLNEGNGDVIGILPDPSGGNGAVEIAGLAARVLTKGRGADDEVVEQVELVDDIEPVIRRPDAAVSTAFYDLSLRRLDLPGSGPRGAIAALQDSVIYAGPKGEIYFIEDPSTAQPTDIKQLNHSIPLSLSTPLLEEENDRDLGIYDIAVRMLDNEKTAELFGTYLGFDGTNACIYMGLAKSILSLDQSPAPSLSRWQEVYRTNPCISVMDKTRGLQLILSGGRIDFDELGDIIITVGSLNQNAQNENVDYGKILRIDQTTYSATLISKGHRNPQGLFIDQAGTIYESEHGPRGGDEINVITEGADYGWPAVTYGTAYDARTYRSEQQGRHEGFKQPLFAFVPSIAISQIIKIEQKSLFPIWSGDILVASLKGRSLYRLHGDEGRIVLVEPIQIGDRIRDLAELDDGSIVLFLDGQRLITLSLFDGVSIAETTEVQAADAISSELREILSAAISYGDSQAGQGKFDAHCSACHSLGASAFVGVGIGPTLRCVIGRRIASGKDFQYSADLRSRAGDIWTAPLLAAFLESPSEWMQDARMHTIRYDDPSDSADVISFLASHNAQACMEGDPAQ